MPKDKQLKESDTKKEKPKAIKKGAAIAALVLALGVASAILEPLEKGANLLITVTDQWQKWFPPSAAELAEKYDKHSPLDGCDADAEAKDQFSLFKPGEDTPIATAKVMHSPSCNTSWVKVSNNLEGATVYKYIERKDTEDLPGAHDDTPNDVTTDTVNHPENHDSFTMQLYAPSCVLVRVELTDSTGTRVDEVPLREVC
ncbi:hypothetical protein [Pseudarthrobacter sp. B4EP4b]|uniref:hypothetical protein n=1 Tax=Pseudarthrobacter sp. B4EP4b TaxID=2590664 RepID=UPI00114D9120|nr:hypothetical protein [Pseudarthrobacter sp. B4EP4b]